MRHWLTAFLITFILAAGLTACDESLAYSHYEHTQLAGWEKSDTLFFDTQRMKNDGRYRVELGLRTTGDFPFTSLSLNIEQHILPELSSERYGYQSHNKRGEGKGEPLVILGKGFPVRKSSLAKCLYPSLCSIPLHLLHIPGDIPE